jgi:hypothetical protein
MNSSTSKVAPPIEWLSLKQLQRYSHLSEKIIQGWIRQPADPLPVTRMGKISLVRRSTFDRWVASEYPLVSELIAHLRKKPARASLLSTSSLYRALYTDQPLCHEAMPWLDHRKFSSPTAAWESCEWGDGMLWLLERTHPLTEQQWLELERAQKPFWIKRLKAQSPAETEQAKAEYQRATARAIRQIVGNPWERKNANTSD